MVNTDKRLGDKEGKVTVKTTKSINVIILWLVFLANISHALIG